MERVSQQIYVAKRLAINALLGIGPLYTYSRKRNARPLGAMYDPDEVIGLFTGHLTRLERAGGSLTDLRALELGPGNSLAMAMLLVCLGAEAVTAIDVRRYASAESGCGVYQYLADQLEQWISEGRLRSSLDANERRDRVAALLSSDASFPDLTGRLRYQTYDGYCFPFADSSFNFFYSIAVMEHVFEPVKVYHELARVMQSGGVCSFIIDLQDHHHRDPFNFLRYSNRMWDRMAGRSSSPTNRMRAAEHLQIFKAAGFKVLWEKRKLASSPPRREDLDPQFREFDDDELRTLTITITAQKL